MKRSAGVLAIGLCLLSGCMDSGSTGTSLSVAPAADTAGQKPPRTASPVITCDFAQVDVPPSFLEQVIDGAIAFRTPSCKTVAVGTLRNSVPLASFDQVVIARFDGAEADATFGAQGRVVLTFPNHLDVFQFRLQSLDGDKVLVMGLSGYRSGITLRHGGISSVLLSSEGVPDLSAYGGLGVDPNEISGDPVVTGFQILSSAQKGSVVAVHGQYTSDDQRVISFDHDIPVAMPNPTRAHFSIPEDCKNYNYKGTAIHGTSFEIQQSSCAIINVTWNHALDSGTTETESVSIIPDGRCFQSKVFGDSCFHYENGVLVRDYLTSDWHQERVYMAITDAGYLCGIDDGGGRTDNNSVMRKELVSSPHPPTDPLFTKECWYQ